MDVLAFTLLVLGIAGLVIWSRHLREAKQMRIRDHIHKERMIAMEKGVPMKDLGHEEMAAGLAPVDGNSEIHGSLARRNVIWIRFSALCLGLIFLFGGIGVAVSLSMVTDGEVKGMWPLGLIPTLIGFGLLLFYGLCRGYEQRLG